MGSRRNAREMALQVLYQFDVRGNDAEADDALAMRLKPTLSKDARDYTLKLVQGVKYHKKQIDALIETASENWSLKRIALVDRNILRLAAFEILYCDDIPHKVAIDEAVELGKEFGTKESGSFINGILDRVSRESSKGGLHTVKKM